MPVQIKPLPEILRSLLHLRGLHRGAHSRKQLPGVAGVVTE